MSETELLDLAAQDIDEGTWDQMVLHMFDDPDDPETTPHGDCGGSCACCASCNQHECSCL